MNRLTRDDVGHRVVVRRWVEDETRGLVPSDVVGELLSWRDDGVLTIRTRQGELVDVAESQILAAKPVPAPRRRP
ncbi:MAG TPA: hypothetical protein VHF25_12510 [Nitriliruptorales bacterium]|nr:hypothetical protein [Nitriliruptorales bacterium]